MITRETIFQSGDEEKIWKRFCSFLDLSVDEFMNIQKRLLEEQIELVGESPLWKKLLNGKKPKTMEEFREMAPLTTYWTHYADYIGNEGDHQYLAEKPLLWAHSSGRGGRFKWVPWTERALEKYADATMAMMILACADRKGEVRVNDGFKIMSILAPSPYISGISGYAMMERFNVRFIPPPGVADTLEFQERIQLGFKIALQTGVDLVGSVSTALVKVGESMTERSKGLSISAFMLRPPVLVRMIRAYLSAKREKRHLLPKDLWPVKGIACGGTDTTIYRDKLRHYWGRVAHEGYGMTEMGIHSMQSWTKKGMVFYPYLALLEFIPEEDWLKTREDPKFKPRTVLLNELQVGKIYEVVITSFNGMPMMRYRPGDLIRVESMEDKETGIKLPQIMFYSRADFLIDLYSIVRLDERTVWQAIDDTKVPYEDWSARKEYEVSDPILRIYFEPKGSTQPAAKDLEAAVHGRLRATCPLYDEAIGEMQTNPVRVTILHPGSFQHYYDRRRAEGADLAHLKPPHMNARDQAIADLLANQKGVELKT